MEKMLRDIEKLKEDIRNLDPRNRPRLLNNLNIVIILGLVAFLIFVINH